MINIKNLVVSGGGFNGFQFFGIIKYLEQNNLIDGIEKFVVYDISFLVTSKYEQMSLHMDSKDAFSLFFVILSNSIATFK